MDAAISIIEDIFAQNAHIRDEREDLDWYDPVARYTELLEAVRYTGAEHYEIQVIEIRRDETHKKDVAWVTSGARGYYDLVRDNEGYIYYETHPGADHWTFEKDDATGCWVIVEFVFNAPRNEQFP
jgi:hypothetical protein